MILVIGLSAAVAFAQAGQETTTTGAPSGQVDKPAEPPPPSAIPAPDIPRSAQDAAVSLREMRAGLIPGPDIEAIREQLPEFRETLTGLKEKTEGDGLEQFSRLALEDVRRQWERHRTQLDDWQAIVEKRTSSFTSQKATLEEMQGLWERTLAAAGDEKFPEELVERVRSVLAEIEDVLALVPEYRNPLLTLQDQLAQGKIKITELLEQVATVEEQKRNELFSQDSEPLWEIWTNDSESTSLSTQLYESWRRKSAAFVDYMEAESLRPVMHVGLFLALLIPMVMLHRRTRQWAREDESFETTARILDRPVSAALLVSLMFTVPIYPDSPRVMWELNTLALFIPLVRILPGIVHPRLQGRLYVLIGILVLFQAGDLILESSLLERLVVLATSGMAFAGLVMALRPEGPVIHLSQGKWSRAAVAVSRLGLITLGASLVCNILGRVSLAKLLSIGTMNSVRGGLLLYTGVLVLNGFVVAIFRTRMARSVAAVRTHYALWKRHVMTVLCVIALGVWVYGTLFFFNISDPVREWLSVLFGTKWSIGTLDISLGDIVTFIFTIWLSIQISRFIRLFLEEDVLSLVDLPRGVPGAISRIVHYVIVSVGFIIALAAAGIELGRFAILFGALGVGIGFGLQGLVNNFVSGLILIFERPIQIGDTIEIGALFGVVRRIGIRSSTVRTYSGAEVIVPNANLISNEVVNWTLSDRLRRFELPVGVAYGTDPSRVLKILIETARNHPDVLSDPEPTAMFKGFGDSSLDFEVRFWTAQFDSFLRVGSDVAVGIHDALKAAEIEIPFPQRDLHLRTVDPEAGRALRSTGGSSTSRPAPQK